MATQKISLKDIDPIHLFGEKDSNLKILQERYNAKIVARGNDIIITGEEDKVNSLKEGLYLLIKEVKEGKSIDKDELIHTIQGAPPYKVIITPKGSIRPRSPGQEEYLKALDEFDIVVAIGPAGTGKTFLAVCKAAALLTSKQVRRIILTRPAVETGERLGFLPGDFKEKVDPYLRPLYDALYEIMPKSKVNEFIKERVIEIAPLAYMRGRNLNNSFVILDEAQNTTKIQMKMFLTRMGINSRACITGDITQVDLKDSKDSGLLHIREILQDISGIKFVYLGERDCVRHKIVKAILKAYGESEENNN
jgi:phosphate starvation-inducible PhoH-like protein